MKPSVLLLTCEHGGNRVPSAYRSAFRGARSALDSHRGQDTGALALARELGRATGAPLLACTTTRLLADTNRSRDHRGVFSEWTRGLPEPERERILARWWQPHRDAVEAFVAGAPRGRRVLHLSIHSFTPRWKGRPRGVDVGFLYDPARRAERAFADRWLAALAALDPDLRLRRNQPYRGNADGLTTTLRRRFGARRYLGLELEVSQRFSLGAPDPWRRLRQRVTESLRVALDRA